MVVDRFFAIPTYRRADVLRDKTLKYLINQGIDPQKIHLFIGGSDDIDDPKYNLKEKYEDLGVGQMYVNFTADLKEQRNWIRNFYQDLANESKSEVEVICMDDDIDDIKLAMNGDDGGYGLTYCDLYELLNKGFNKCREEGLCYWGISGGNPMFMMGSAEYTTTLKNIQGGFNGEIYKPNQSICEVHINQYEDIELSMAYFLRDGGVLRLNRYALMTNRNWDKVRYKIEGGMNENMTLEGRIMDKSVSVKYLQENYDNDMFKVNKKGDSVQLNWRYKKKEPFNWDRVRVCIPSKGRPELKDFTLFGDDWSNLPFKLHFFVPEEECEDYDYLQLKGAIVIAVPPEYSGIGRTRDYMLNERFNATYNYVLMIDDDIKCLRRFDDDLSSEDILCLIKEMTKTLEDREAYFGGITLCNNSFYMKSGVSNTLKYISGAFQLHRLSNRKAIRTDYRHFEDYVCNMEYFKRDGIICRWNDITPITKNYNEEGGICSDYGSLEARLKDAEECADRIIDEYPEGWVSKYYKKKSSRCPACWNLKLNYRAKY